MPLEFVNTLATVGTFLVIAATAIAAIVQLRHVRAGNQIVALNALQVEQTSDEFRSAWRDIQEELPDLLLDPEFRKLLYAAPLPDRVRPMVRVGNFYEVLGALVKNGAIDRRLALDLWAGPILLTWRAFSPIVAAQRYVFGPLPYENFGYLAALGRAWLDRYPHGTLPKNAPTIEVDDRFVKEDVAAGIAPPPIRPGSL